MTDPTGSAWTAEEAMVIAASRFLRGSSVCFIGIGYPSTAAMLALRTHAPELYLVYESGTLGPRPRYVPLSVADNELRRDGADSRQRARDLQLLASAWAT